MKMKISGTIIPNFFPPSYTLRDAHFHWDDKVDLRSGRIRVDYDPFSLFFSRNLRAKISSQDLSMKLLDDWAKSQGVEQIGKSRLVADLAFGPEGIEEIYTLDLKSSSFQFRIAKSET